MGVSTNIAVHTTLDSVCNAQLKVIGYLTINRFHNFIYDNYTNTINKSVITLIGYYRCKKI